MADTETTIRAVRSFWGRVLVIESPVDESQRQSGLVVPLNFSEDGTGHVQRGGGVRLLDQIALDMSEILAYEP